MLVSCNVGDEVAYDDDFGYVLDTRLPLDRAGGFDVLVEWPNGTTTWCWNSDLSPADERREENEYYDCPCAYDLSFEDHQMDHGSKSQPWLETQ